GGAASRLEHGLAGPLRRREVRTQGAGKRSEGKVPRKEPVRACLIRRVDGSRARRRTPGPFDAPPFRFRGAGSVRWVVRRERRDEPVPSPAVVMRIWRRQNSPVAEPASG